jgi:hypothetical protein
LKIAELEGKKAKAEAETAKKGATDGGHRIDKEKREART